MKRLALASFATLVASSCVSWVACSNSNSNGPGNNPPASDSGPGGNIKGSDAGDDGGLNPSLPCTDTIASVYGDPGSFASLDAGSIIHCAFDEEIPVAALTTRLTQDLCDDPAPGADIGYIGKPLTSGVRVYRILYRTERGDPAGSPGYSSAEVLIPDAPRAANLPILVASHGSRGQAGVCTASQEADAASDVNGDYDALGLPLAGLGYAVILPDLAGYSNFGAAGNPPSAYADVEDVGKSTLDGARALAQLVPGLSNKVVLVGHSQGGSTEYSAVSLLPTYAPELTLSAVAAYSPLWLNQASWGALLFEASDYPVAIDPGTNAVSVWYHYTHSVLLDGPDAGLELFAPAVAPQIQNFVNNDCWGEWTDLEDAGTVATDFFTSSFASSIAKPAALGTPCATGDTVCSTWMARYAADRPHLVTQAPFLIWYGGADQTIPPPRMACVIQRLGPPTADYPGADNLNMTFCLDPLYGHSGIVRAHASDVADWIGAQVLGESQPPPCQYTQANLIANEGGTVDPTDDGGVPILCETPPPN